MKVKTKMYLHGDEENFYDDAKEIGLNPDNAAFREFSNALYEVEFEVEVDTETGETKILKVDGRVW